MRFEKLDFIPMTESDVPALVPIMKRAFEYDAIQSGRAQSGPDGFDNGEFIRKRLSMPDVDAFRIELDGVTIGAIMMFIHEDTKDGHLSLLFIDCDFMGSGYGEMAWRFIEHAYPFIEVWTLNTSAVSYRNHCFYINKLGFHVVQVTREMDRSSALFQLEKIIRR